MVMFSFIQNTEFIALMKAFWGFFGFFLLSLQAKIQNGE